MQCAPTATILLLKIQYGGSIEFDHIKSLGELIDKLHAGETGDFKRINNIPGKELLYEGEFSQYSDFPGHTSLSSIATVLEVKAVEKDISLDSLVYPVITHTYQFSLVVGVFID